VQAVDALLRNVAVAQAHKAHAARDAVVVREDAQTDDDVRRKELLQRRIVHVQRQAMLAVSEEQRLGATACSLAQIDIGAVVVGHAAQLGAEALL